LIATAAAELNRDEGRLVVTISQGVNLDPFDSMLRLRVIENALHSAAHANRIFPGTVWGVTVKMPSSITPEFLSQVQQKAISLRLWSNKSGIKVGTSTVSCEAATSPRLAGITKRIVKEFADQLDYLCCDLRTELSNAVDPLEAVKKVGSAYNRYVEGLRRFNSTAQVIMTGSGWASFGKMDGNKPTRMGKTSDLHKYWSELGKWAAMEQAQVQIFEAFDQPWKTNPQIQDPNDLRGIFGAGSHYGWWKITPDQSYVEKIQGYGLSII